MLSFMQFLVNRRPSRILSWRMAFIVAGIAIINWIAPAVAASSFQQVPGVYRQLIGSLQVTALFDGVVMLPRGYLHDLRSSSLESLLDRSYVPESAKGLQTAVNAYLVHWGEHWTLVDTGTANCFGSELGQVLDNLRSAGQRPEDIDTVLPTHAHPDHLCGLLDREGRMAYPNATVWLSAEDADYWLNPEAQTKAPEAMRGLFDMARRAIAPYEAAGRFKRFTKEEKFAPGMTALPSHGHTPGHTSWLFEGGDGQHLLIWGDIVHYHAVQFTNPTASFEFDSDRQQAIATRQALLARAAEQGWWVAGAHLPFPGLGHIRAEQSGGYRWVPTEFSPIPVENEASQPK